MTKLFNHYHSPELIAKLYLNYYGFIVVHTKPVEECTEQLRKAYKGTCTPTLERQGRVCELLVRVLSFSFIFGKRCMLLLKKLA